MTKLIGILNLTPDSFSDGGKFFSEKQAIDQTFSLIEAGANVIDVGAESTRPHATILTPEEEWLRIEKILPQIIKICQEHEVEVSFDSVKFINLKKAAELGTHWLNDVSGKLDSNIIELAKNFNQKIVLMHSLTVPANPKVTIPESEDVVLVIKKWLFDKINHLKKFNFNIENAIFDPGIGFGKTAHQSIEIIKRIEEFKECGLKIYVGHSRKSFFSTFSNAAANDRDIETCVLSTFLYAKKIDYLRVHDVKENLRAIQTYKKFFGESENA